MKKVFVLLVCLTISIVSLGQEGPASVAAVSEIPPGPSMKETEAWIKRELRSMGSDYVVTSSQAHGVRWGTKYEIESAVMSECSLTIRSSEQDDESFGRTPTRRSVIAIVTLKDVDVGKLLSKEKYVVPGSTMNKPSYEIIVVALSDRGDPFVRETEGYAGGKAKKAVRAVRLHVRDESMGNQTVEVFRRAAILCGAPSQPATTAVAESVEKQKTSPTNPASNTTSKMTNDEVIQLVSAGLSEQVIITSIRQTPTKDFNLSPTGLIALKKANVPDAVIVVMQENGTREQTSAGENKTPPKYDATLTTKTASPEQDSCSYIEAMGIFKNTAIDPAIGGGVVEWLAKIRNNTNVTKIVVFSWIDMYGQQRKAQEQIRGGDIASIRLDLTQARLIAPVRDLRVVSCQ